MSYIIKEHNTIEPAAGQIWDDGKKRYQLLEVSPSAGNWDGRVWVKFAALDKSHITHHWQDLENFKKAFPHAQVAIDMSSRLFKLRKIGKGTIGQPSRKKSPRKAAGPSKHQPNWTNALDPLACRREWLD